MKDIGKTIRALRRQRGWTQEDVANRLGISIPAISKIENGLTDISLSRIQHIAGLFDLSVVSLLANGQEPDSPSQVSLRSANKKLRRRENEITALQLKVAELFEQLNVTACSIA